MAVVGLLTLLSALNGVQPSAGFALDAKPLELSLLDNEYCVYGLRRHPPHKWCICWGKIDTRIEVLPWDCSTRAPKFMSRRKRDQNWNLDNFLRGLNTRDNLFPQDLLKADRKWEMPRVKLQKQKTNPKQSMLEKALTVMFKQVAESSSDDRLLATQLSYFLLPYLRSDMDSNERKKSAFSRAMSTLKSMLLELGSSRNVEDFEESLIKDLLLLKRKLLTVKNSLVADFEELLQILKDFPSRNQSGAARKGAGKGHFGDIRRNQIAPAEDQKLRSVPQSSKVSASVLEPYDAKVRKSPPTSDQIGLNMILKLGNNRNYSNVAEMLGKTFAEVFGLVGGRKNVSEAAPKSSVAVHIAKIQYSATDSAEKSSEPEIQAPANLTQPEPVDSGNPKALWSKRNHSNVAEILGKTFAEAIGLKESPENGSELDSAPKSSVIAEIQGSASEGIEKLNAESEIQASANLTQPNPVDPGNPPKLQSTRNYSNVAETLGKTFAEAIGLKESPKNVSELDSALQSSVVAVRIAEIRDSPTDSTEKSSAEAKIQAPENLTRLEFVDSDSADSVSTNSTPGMENPPPLVRENSLEFTNHHKPSLVDDDSHSTESPELEIMSLNNLKIDNTSSVKFDLEDETYKPKPDSVRYWE